MVGQNLSRRYRDEEAYPIRHPALKYRAKVTPPLRGEEGPILSLVLTRRGSDPLRPPGTKVPG